MNPMREAAVNFPYKSVYVICIIAVNFMNSFISFFLIAMQLLPFSSATPKDPEKPEYLSKLPYEIVLLIAGYLMPHDIKNLRKMCTSLRITQEDAKKRIQKIMLYNIL